MTIEIKIGVELYNKACSAEEKGEMDLAEVYYLKSAYLFEQAGKAGYLNAANAFNALAFLRETRGNYAGALCAAKKSAQILENYREQTASHDSELIRMKAWELINDLISYDVGSRTYITQTG